VSFATFSRTRRARTPLLATWPRTERDARPRRESVSRILRLLCPSSAASPRAPTLTGHARAGSLLRVARLAGRHVPLAASDPSRIGVSRRLYKVSYSQAELLTSVSWVRGPWIEPSACRSGAQIVAPPPSTLTLSSFTVSPRPCFDRILDANPNIGSGYGPRARVTQCCLSSKRRG
jgi:hypothetical protein